MKRLFALFTVVLLTAMGAPVATAERAAMTTNSWHAAADSASITSIVKGDRESSVSPEHRRYLARLAEAEGISTERAIELYSWQDEFARGVTLIRQAFPDTFAEASMNRGGDAGAEIHFTRIADRDSVAALVKKMRLPIDVKIVDQSPYSFKQVETAVKVAHYSAYESAGGASVSTEYDEDSGQVVSSVEGLRADPTTKASLEAGMQEAISGSLDDGEREIPAVVHPAPAGSISQDVIRGGALLGGSSSSNFACTSGWSVGSTTAGGEGIVTADHCDNSMSYSGRNVLRYGRSLPKSDGDIQYMYSTSEDVVPEFYVEVGNYRTVLQWGTPVMFMILERFGRKTGYKGSNRVRDLSTCRNDYCGLVSMEDREADSGDSGGPWFSFKTAYGVHSGGHWHLGHHHDQFTPIAGNFGPLNLWLKKGQQ